MVWIASKVVVAYTMGIIVKTDWLIYYQYIVIQVVCNCLMQTEIKHCTVMIINVINSQSDSLLVLKTV